MRDQLDKKESEHKKNRVAHLNFLDGVKNLD